MLQGRQNEFVNLINEDFHPLERLPALFRFCTLLHVQNQRLKPLRQPPEPGFMIGHKSR